MQNKKANEFSPTLHYFHEMNVMMTLFATFFFLASELLIPSYPFTCMLVLSSLYNAMERQSKLMSASPFTFKL